MPAPPPSSELLPFNHEQVPQPCPIRAPLAVGHGVSQSEACATRRVPPPRHETCAPAHLARGAAALADGRHAGAFDHLWPVFDEASPSFHRFMRWPALLDLVEAATGCGHHDQAQAVLADLAPILRTANPPILRANLTCARALTADDDDADEEGRILAVRDRPFWKEVEEVGESWEDARSLARGPRCCDGSWMI